MDKYTFDHLNKLAEVVAKKHRLKQEDKEDLIQRVWVKYIVSFNPQKGSTIPFLKAIASTEALMINRSFFDRREDLRAYFDDNISNNSYYTYDHELLELQSDRLHKINTVAKHLSKQQKKLLLALCRGKTVKQLRKKYPGRKFYSSIEQVKLKMKRFVDER